MEILKLPEHVLIKICEFAGVDELKMLMESCRFFNHLISTDKSVMSKFQFKWNITQKRNVYKRSIKEYQHVKLDLFGDFYRRSTVTLFKKFAHTLESFTIQRNGIHTGDIHSLLMQLAPNNKIKQANFSFVFFRECHTNDYLKQKPIVVNSLEELFVEKSDCRILRFFHGTQISRFTFYARLDRNKHEFIDFLKTQKRLKYLNLDAGSVYDLFMTNVAENLEFKLEELEFRIRGLTSIQATNCNAFLKKQAATTKSLKIDVGAIDSLWVIDTMLNNVKIKKICLQVSTFTLFGNEQVMVDILNITHLVLNVKTPATHSSISNLSHLKNVKELTLIEVCFNYSLLDALKELTKLTKVTMKKSQQYVYAPLPQVTEMTFHAENFKDVCNFLKVNRSIVKVKVCGDREVHVGYLGIMFRQCPHVRHFDFSKLKETDDTLLVTIARFGRDMGTLVFPKKYRKKEFDWCLPQSDTIIEYA